MFTATTCTVTKAPLASYHKGDESYAFLNFRKIKNYDDLNSLFFSVLARRQDSRVEEVRKQFEKVPYLNNSLFELTSLENQAIVISNLRNERTLPVISGTVLKQESGKKRTGSLNTIEYLFAFMESYDFSSEGSEDIREENKTLINTSILGLIFEKINGYKDGSFFTPGFMPISCRESESYASNTPFLVNRFLFFGSFPIQNWFRSDKWSFLLPSTPTVQSYSISIFPSSFFVNQTVTPTCVSRIRFPSWMVTDQLGKSAISAFQISGLSAFSKLSE